MDDGYSWGNEKEITKEEFVARFIKDMHLYILNDGTGYLLESAEASYHVWVEDGKDKSETPEDYAEAERDCWE
jgi:hypothetical protein